MQVECKKQNIIEPFLASPIVWIYLCQSNMMRVESRYFFMRSILSEIRNRGLKARNHCEINSLLQKRPSSCDSSRHLCFDESKKCQCFLYVKIHLTHPSLMRWYCPENDKNSMSLQIKLYCQPSIVWTKFL